MASAESVVTGGHVSGGHVVAAHVSQRLELQGRYFLPRSSLPHAVTLRLDAGRVQVTGDGIDSSCGAHELRLEPPVLGQALGLLRLPSGAQLELPEGPELGLLRQSSGQQLPYSRVYRWEQSWRAAWLAVLFVVGTVLVGYRWVIPWGALQAARAWPSLGQRIGRGALSLIDHFMLEPSQLQPAERERIRRLFELGAADFPTHHFQLELRHAGFANAFALPDGTLVLTDELVRLSQHDDQLLGVIFHELGHVVQGHALRRLIESSSFTLLVSAYYGDADQLTAVASGLPVLFATSRYSRQEETEADDVALAGLLRHDKDPVQLAHMLRALERDSGPVPIERKYFSSHPAVEERAQRLERAARPAP